MVIELTIDEAKELQRVLNDTFNYNYWWSGYPKYPWYKPYKITWGGSGHDGIQVTYGANTK